MRKKGTEAVKNVDVAIGDVIEVDDKACKIVRIESVKLDNKSVMISFIDQDNEMHWLGWWITATIVEG